MAESQAADPDLEPLRQAIVIDDLGSLELTPAEPIIYDQPIGLRLLHQDPSTGAEHYLGHYPCGLRTRLHRHTAAQTIIVLKGRLEANGRTVGPGSYCHFPAGEPMRHSSAAGSSCLFVTIFDGAFDVESLE